MADPEILTLLNTIVERLNIIDMKLYELSIKQDHLHQCTYYPNTFSPHENPEPRR